MGRTLRLCIIVFTLLIGLAGCSRAESIGIYEMISFGVAKENSFKKITDASHIELVKQSLLDMHKNHGVANMNDPHYKIQVGSNQFYVWINEEYSKVTLINLNNTNTSYTLSREYAETVMNLILDQYN